MIKKRNTAMSHSAMQDVAKNYPIEVTDRHEKKSGHSPALRRNGLQVLIFSKELKKYCCPLPNCPLTLKYKSNITWHIKAGGQTLSKKEVYCKEAFAQKSNRDRHI